MSLRNSNTPFNAFHEPQIGSVTHVVTHEGHLSLVLHHKNLETSVAMSNLGEWVLTEKLRKFNLGWLDLLY